jgi:hypothetical protein
MLNPIDRITARFVGQLARAHLALRRRFGHRFMAPYRVVLRKLGAGPLRRVTDLPPVEVPIPGPGDACLHVLTKWSEWTYALWACRSLLTRLAAPLPVYIHDDGSLGDQAIAAVRRSLPGVQVIRRADADDAVLQALQGLPRCRQLREENILSLKLFDPWVVQPTGDVILLDSDVLFFRRPVEIEAWLRSAGRVNLWNVGGDYSAETLARARAALHTNHPTVPVGFNAGLGLIPRSVMSFDAAEEVLSHASVSSNPWLTEQNVYGLLGIAADFTPLPRRYFIATPSGRSPNVRTLTAKHYVGASRGLFVSEGLLELARQHDQEKGASV